MPRSRSPCRPYYKYIATLPPGAVLSLPDYAQDPLWFQEANYQYFSTAHWHPAVNGDAREFPPQFVDLAERMKRFPAPERRGGDARGRREVMVLHAAQRGAEDLLAPAVASDDFRLLVTIRSRLSVRGRPVRRSIRGPTER